MRYLLYLPAIIFFLLPLLCHIANAMKARSVQRQREAAAAAAAEKKRIESERNKAIQAAKAEERERVKAAKEAEQQRKQAARLEAARLRAEYAERELAARREMKALERGGIIPAATETAQPEAPAEPVEQVLNEADEQPASEPVSVLELLKSRVKGNNAFVGHVVAFTGKLPGMTRREAIRAVQDNGGKAFEKMPAGTTLLVVGDKPGMRKMDKADEWIGQVRKITAAQFFAMLEQPLEMELDEFAALLTA